MIHFQSLLLQAAGTKTPEGMTTNGWIFMITSITFVLLLTGWCFKRVLADDDEITEPPATLGG